MSFFADWPAPEIADRQEPEYRRPEWSGAPENMVPCSVAVDAPLVRTDEFAVWITDVLAYPTGVALGLVLMRRHVPATGGPPSAMLFRPGSPAGPRFGVAFADGRKIELDDIHRARAGESREIALAHGSGGGTERQWHGRFWLWPLPPEGPLTFAFTWPEQGIAESLLELDGAPIREAAARAVELWPDDRPLPPSPGDGSWKSFSHG